MTKLSDSNSFETNTSQAASRAATYAQNASDTAASKLRDTEEKLRTAAAESSRRFAETQEKAKEQGKKAMEYIKTNTRKNPLLVAGVALAIGALATLLFKRD